MATTSPEPSLPSSPPSSFDGAAVGLAPASGDGLNIVIVAAALETIAHGGNNQNNGDDGDKGEGVAVSVAVALGMMTAAVITL
jgi:hypothetical protein